MAKSNKKVGVVFFLFGFFLIAGIVVGVWLLTTKGGLKVQILYKWKVPKENRRQAWDNLGRYSKEELREIKRNGLPE